MSSDETTQLGTKPPAAVGPGTQLNGIYEIDELIASGGMGEVYRGHNIRNKTSVAIKIILPEFANDETVLSLFVRESDTLNHLSHDAIVRYHLFGVDPVIERPYLSMEFVDGIALADCIKKKKFELTEVRRLLIRICEGLAAAHAAGVIHRDLSPDNVILPGGKVKKAKIIDFGIAKSTASGHATLLGGKFAGKYNFVSPEQLGRFEGVVTGRSDIYSLGLVAVAALRGKPIDMSGSHVEVVEKRSEVPDISDIDEAIKPLLESMLQPDPADRPESMEAIVTWLEAMPTASPVASGEAVTTVTDPSVPPDSETSVVSEVSSHDKNLPPHSVAPQSVAPQSVAPKSEPPKSAAPQSVAPKSMPPQSVAPQSTPPQSVAPQPDTTSVSEVNSEVNSVVESPFGPPSAAEIPDPAMLPSEPPHNQKKNSKNGLYALLGILLLGAGSATAYFMTQDNSGGDGDEPVPVAESSKETTTDPGPSDQIKDTPKQLSDSEGEVDTALVTPETEPVTPETTEQTEEISKPMGIVASRIDWLQKYDGGPCFFASGQSVSETKVEIEGYSISTQPFEKMLAAFRDAHGVEPDIGVRLIRSEQCAVPQFLHDIRPNAGRPVELVLSSDLIKSGEAIKGGMTGIKGRKSGLLLVDSDGFVYNLDIEGITSKTESLLTFAVETKLNTVIAVPQLVVGIASDLELESMRPLEPQSAEKIFPAILKEIREKGAVVSATTKFFKIGGS